MNDSLNDNYNDNIIYFDNNATTQSFKEVCRAVESARTIAANASSYHRPGGLARFMIERSRARVASFIGARPSEIVFTASGSEANNLALAGVINYYKYVSGITKPCVIITAAEHSSVYNFIYNPVFKDVKFIMAPLDKNGIIDTGALDSLITSDVILVSAMMANNETGVIMPYERIGEICAKKSVLYHCDAVCAGGKLKFNVKDFYCDLLSLSAHKMYGPEGAACLYKKRGVEILPLIIGGAQENGLRAGTENVSAIEGFGVCCELIASGFDKIKEHYLEIKRYFIQRLFNSAPGVKINGANVETLANTVSAVFRFECAHEAEAFMFALDMHGLAVSRGAACASGAKKPSRVLTAAGANELEAMSSVRFSFGINNTIQEAGRAVEIIKRSYETVCSARKAVIARD